MTAVEYTTAPRFGLLIIGDEILSGKRADQHFAKVLNLLSARGLRLSWARYLPDDRALLTENLRQTFALSARENQVIFSCGGIGSTSDDHTRQSAAAALNVDLVLHPEAEALISQRCADMARQGQGSADMSLPENQRRLEMGVFPKGACIIPNPYNQIPGFGIQQHWFVPGFPVMAWPMLEAVLNTHYAQWFHQNPQGERSLFLFETMEATIAPLMEQVEFRYPSIKAFSLPSVGDGRDGAPKRRHIELGVKGSVQHIDAAFQMLLQWAHDAGAQFEIRT